MPSGTKLPSFLHVLKILTNSLFIFDSMILMLLACKPQETCGIGMGGPSGQEHFEFFFLHDSVLLMLHALRLEAPLIASGLKDFESFTILIMTLFLWCCILWGSKLHSYLQVSRILTLYHFFSRLCFLDATCPRAWSSPHTFRPWGFWWFHFFSLESVVLMLHTSEPHETPVVDDRWG